RRSHVRTRSWETPKAKTPSRKTATRVGWCCCTVRRVMVPAGLPASHFIAVLSCRFVTVHTCSIAEVQRACRGRQTPSHYSAQHHVRYLTTKSTAVYSEPSRERTIHARVTGPRGVTSEAMGR